MKLKQIVLTLGLILSFTVFVNAQEQDLTDASNVKEETPARAIVYNPNGVQIAVENNAVLLHFKDRATNVKCEIINKKGERLMVKRAKSTKLTKFDISNFKKGKYYVRVFSDDLEDFLRFTKK